ncbi:hypothetical protein BDW69DRAFT_180519 [Aspergillus filifer]
MPAGGYQERDPTRIPQGPVELIRARVNQALQEGESAAGLADGQVPDLIAVALLGCLPNPRTEPLLAQFTASVIRLINHAYQAICLRHQLNTAQLVSLDQMEEYGLQLQVLATEAASGPGPAAPAAPAPVPPASRPPPPKGPRRTIPWKKKPVPASSLPRLAPRVEVRVPPPPAHLTGEIQPGLQPPQSHRRFSLCLLVKLSLF